jgi:hypothetical protein
VPPLQHIAEIYSNSAKREYYHKRRRANDTMSDSGNPMSSPNVDVDRLKEYMDSMSRSGFPPPEEVQALINSVIKKGLEKYGKKSQKKRET